jgi:uncharacterized membrane protein (UPF0127 family)
MPARVSAVALPLAILTWSALVWGAEVNPPLPTATVVLAGRVSIVAELAQRPEEQILGLSNRPVLPPGRGMLFVYDRPQPVGIWMKDMRFSLDILWIREGQIVKIEKQAPPLAPGGPERVYTATADLVLEVPAGFADRAHIRLGDTARVRQP